MRKRVRGVSVYGRNKYLVHKKYGYRKKHSWTVNGALFPQDKERYFYANVEEQNEEILFPSIRKGSYIMMHASRASGKTTRINAAIQQLRKEKDYIPLSISLDSGVDLENLSTFWNDFGESLQENNPSVKIPDIQTARDFHRVFAVGPFDRPIVLFVDEFDMLYSAASERVQASVLGVLRNLKQTPDTALHSVVAIGPFSVLELVGGKIGSPFNVRHSIQSPPFTWNQTEDLFKQFSDERRLNLDTRIVEDIWLRTDGHSGCVDYCGKALDERLLRGKSQITYSEWLRYATCDLADEMGETWPTLGKMIYEFTIPENGRAMQTEKDRIADIKAARHVLCSSYIPSCTLMTPPPLEKRHSRYLAAEGALKSMDNGISFQVRSPLIRSLLINRILPLERRQIPKESPPICHKGKLDTVKALELLLPYFNPQLLQNRLIRKKSKAPGVVGSLVPQEDMYQTEILALLKLWLPTWISVYSQPLAIDHGAVRVQKSKGRPPHSDILLVSEENILIELAAHVNQTELEEHIHRAVRDAEALQAQAAYVVHFTTAEFDSWLNGSNVVGDYCEIPVKVIHIMHDGDWEEATMRVDDGTPKEMKLQNKS